MNISFRKALFFSGFGSLLLLISAFSLEIFANLEPCKLCIWQRWPHAIIVILALFGLYIIKKTWTLLLICLSAVISGGIGIYHTGIEQMWWSGPMGCSSNFGNETDITTLTNLLLDTQVVKCDEIVWSLFGISMASWNSIFSFFIAVLSFICWCQITIKRR